MESLGIELSHILWKEILKNLIVEPKLIKSKFTISNVEC